MTLPPRAGLLPPAVTSCSLVPPGPGGAFHRLSLLPSSQAPSSEPLTKLQLPSVTARHNRTPTPSQHAHIPLWTGGPDHQLLSPPPSAFPPLCLQVLTCGSGVCPTSDHTLHPSVLPPGLSQGPFSRYPNRSSTFRDPLGCSPQERAKGERKDAHHNRRCPLPRTSPVSAGSRGQGREMPRLASPPHCAQTVLLRWPGLGPRLLRGRGSGAFCLRGPVSGCHRIRNKTVYSCPASLPRVTINDNFTNGEESGSMPSISALRRRHVPHERALTRPQRRAGPHPRLWRHPSWSLVLA